MLARLARSSSQIHPLQKLLDLPMDFYDQNGIRASKVILLTRALTVGNYMSQLRTPKPCRI